VRARLLGRRSATLLVTLAVAGAIVVVGSLFGVAAVTGDLATQKALAELEPRERAIQVNRFGDGAIAEEHADEAVRAALTGLTDFTQPVVAAISFQPRLVDTRYFGLDNLAARVIVTEGRLPEPCREANACEAIRVGEFVFGPDGPGSIGYTEQLDQMRFTIVGVGRLKPGLPLDPLAQYPFVALVDGVAELATAPALADAPRTRFWVAPLEPTRTHAWTLAALTERVDVVERRLASEDSGFTVQSPEVAFGAIQARTAIAAGRLVFIGSFIVAVLLAFAVFAAAVEREDVGLEVRRLRIHGATLGQRLLFVAAEAAAPSVAGALLGWLAAAAVVAAIGLSQGATPLEILGVSLFEPFSLAVISGIAVLAAIAVGLGIHPESGRLIRPRLIAVAVLPAAAILVWDRISRGRVSAEELAAQAAGPGTVLLPGFLGLSVILLSLVVMPPVFRRLARVGRRWPLALRLGLISIAREPLRPTATMTLLAFSLGAAVFALGYAATLRQGAADSAAFTTGMDLRVQPLDPTFEVAADVHYRLDQAPPIDVELYPIHSEAGRTATDRQLTIVGIEPEAIPRLRGWRSDFSSSTPAELAAAIALPGDWRLPGHALGPRTRVIPIQVTASGDPIALTMVVESEDGRFWYVPLGDLREGTHEMRAELYAEGDVLPEDFTSGWRVVAFVASNGGPAGALGEHAGERQQADIRIAGLEDLFASDVSHHIDVSGSHRSQVVRPPAPTDGLVLPAVVSPGLEDDVDGDGVLRIRYSDGLEVAVRPVATTELFPTVTEAGQNIVVVDGRPLATALDAEAQGRGAATDVLVRSDDPAVLQAVETRLTAGVFSGVAVISRAALETDEALDPFALGVAWSLAVGAIAGVGLSLAGMLLAAVARLRDERGDLAELEEQGVRPGSLAWLAVVQTLVVAVVGLAIGAAIGLGLGWLTAASIAVGGSGVLPVPPLRLAAPWAAIGLLLLGVLAGLAVVITAIARRHFSGALVREDER
jgi:hypothetical protein